MLSISWWVHHYNCIVELGGRPNVQSQGPRYSLFGLAAPAHYLPGEGGQPDGVERCGRYWNRRVLINQCVDNVDILVTNALDINRITKYKTKTIQETNTNIRARTKIGERFKFCTKFFMQLNVKTG